MATYNALREEGQGFFLKEISILFEKPDSVLVPFISLSWWCDLEFLSDDADTNNYGYVGRGVEYILDSSFEKIVAQGAQTPPGNWATSVSAVMNPTLGIFEGQYHPTHDDWVNRYWDNGSSTLPIVGWEGHDEGDMSPNADTSALSLSGAFTKITTEEAAKFLGMDVGDMTPANCSKQYKEAWNINNVPDPISTSVTALEEKVAQLEANMEEKVAQLEANINELLSRMAATEEGSLTTNGSGNSNDEDSTSTSSSPFMAWYEHTTTNIVVKSILTVAIIIGLIAVDFI